MMYNHRRHPQRFRVADISAKYLAWCADRYESREPSNHKCAIARLALHARTIDRRSWLHAIEELRQANLSVSYQRGCHRRWLAMLSWATEFEMLDAATLYELQQIRFKPRPKANANDDLIVIDEDWCEGFRSRFWPTIDFMPNWLAEITLMCFYTGARPKEIYTLTTSSIATHQSQRVIVLKTHKTQGKTRMPRYIALNRPARRIIDSKLKPICPDDWIWPAFRDQSNHISYSVIQQNLARIIKRHGLRKWCLYDCRRHAASIAVSNASPAAARSLLGHSNLQTTSLYALPSLRDAKLAADALEVCHER